LIAGGSVSVVVIVFVVVRLRQAGRTLDSIMDEHHDRMERLSHQEEPDDDAITHVPVRRGRGAHRRQPGQRAVPVSGSRFRRRPMSA
jgi:hypothetical protein